MDPTIRLSARVAQTIAQQAAGDAAIVEPKDAATVILLRTGESVAPGELQVHLMRRQSTMAFASGMAVFPGGGVDPADFDTSIAWAGPSVSDWSGCLQVPEPHALALIVAAVRETFEECGVLLAGDLNSRILTDTSGEQWESDRQRVVSHEISLAELLRERGLLLRSDLLQLWSLWTTPEFEPRRYRTWFFTAELPFGQVTRDVSTEAVEVQWMSLGDALRRARDHDLLMLPPQYSSCLELFAYRTPADVRAAQRNVFDIQPGVAFDDDGAYLVLPAHLVELGNSVEALL